MIDLKVDGRVLAIEIIAKLAYIKNSLFELILEPAGVSPKLYQPLFQKKDVATGKALSKRKVAPLLLDALAKEGKEQNVIHALVRIAAEWDNFHLADNEYEARAVVQKAREFLGTIQIMEEREAALREETKQAELESLQLRRADIVRRESALLLMMFDSLSQMEDRKERGYLLQELLNRLFVAHGMIVTGAFTRNGGAEQIDGAFRLDGWRFLVECRWREKLANIRELDGLLGPVTRSGKPGMGLFLSIEGWSENVIPLLKQNAQKNIMLMDGYDLRVVLDRCIDLTHFLNAKCDHLSNECEPHLGVRAYLAN